MCVYTISYYIIYDVLYIYIYSRFSRTATGNRCARPRTATAAPNTITHQTSRNDQSRGYVYVSSAPPSQMSICSHGAFLSQRPPSQRHPFPFQGASAQLPPTMKRASSMREANARPPSKFDHDCNAMREASARSSTADANKVPRRACCVSCLMPSDFMFLSLCSWTSCTRGAEQSSSMLRGAKLISNQRSSCARLSIVSSSGMSSSRKERGLRPESM